MGDLSPLRVYTADVTVPAKTAQTSPQVTALGYDVGTLARFRVVIPAGHAFRTGFALRYARQQVFPFRVGQWLVGNGETYDVPLAFDLVGSQLDVQAYNTDVHPHTFHLRLQVEDFPIELVPVVPAAPGLIESLAPVEA